MGANLLNIVVTLALQSPSPDTSLTTSPASGFAFERLSDLLQYNRVQGLSFGVGYQLPVPGIRSASVYGTVRYGFSDERVTGRLTFLRRTPAGRLAVSGFHDIADLDPFSPGRTLGNTANGLLAGHDNGDYALARGASLSFQKPLRSELELGFGGRVERMSSVSRAARSAVNDFLGGSGLFPPNPPVQEGTFTTFSVRLRHGGRTRWSVTTDLSAGADRTIGRLFGDLLRHVGTGSGLTVRVKAGAGTEPSFGQSLFRLGGVHTVRGFEYGSLRAPAFWAAQLDLTPFGGRIRPVVFLDAGQADRLSRLPSSKALVGAGLGLSLFSGLIRFDLSRPLSPDLEGKVRFDVVARAPR